MTYLILFAFRLYPYLLRFYPRRFREEFAEEMTAVFHQQVQTAASDSPRAVMTVLGRELRSWPLNCLREHVWERNRQLLLPQTPFLSRWGVIAAAMPFLIYFMSVSPALPRSLPILFLLAGIFAAWWQRWPGWVVSWLGFLIFYGQNWLPYSLLGDETPWNTIPRLLNMFSEVVFQTGWLIVMYLVVHRWPRHGALVFLPFLLFPWFFSMEFASEAMTAVFFTAVFLLLALTAAAISAQKTNTGDIWLIFVGALLPGALLTQGDILFSTGSGEEWRRFGPRFLEALAPFAILVLLQSLNAWSRENAPPARRQTRLMTMGALLAWMALLALGRLIGPSTLEDFQLVLSPVLAVVWLLGVLLILLGGWRLRPHFALAGKRYLALAVGMLVLLPLLYRPSFLSHTVNSLAYQNPELESLRSLRPALETADYNIAILGLVGLLLLPLPVGRLRRQTAAFPPSPAGLSAWWQRRRESPEAKNRSGGAWSGVKRLALLLTLAVLAAGGLFFATVFLPMQVEAEPYTQQIVLGDLDGDGDLDAALANTMRLLPNAENKILYNDGRGRFSHSGLTIGMGGTSVALLDSDGDGDLDVLAGGMMGGSEFNNDNRSFVSRPSLASWQSPESGTSQYAFQVGDLNHDGLTDVFMAGCCGIGISQHPGEMRWVPAANRLLFGSDKGLVDSYQRLGTRGSQAVDLGDLDGDGDLDAFVGNTQSSGEDVTNDEPNEVWLNDGQGNFSDSGQLLGRQRTYAVALGDVDGDGDLDALVGNEGMDELWLNDGRGRFSLATQSWSSRKTLVVFLADLDGDGDLDALTGHQISSTFAWWRQAIIWWNDGRGRFTQGDQRIRYRPNATLTVGDVNGDSLPDIVGGALDKVTVWLNEGDGRFGEVSS